nr:hypothetical protein [Paenibacillus polymyxa]
MENKDALTEVEERLRSPGSCAVPRKQFVATSMPMKPKGCPLSTCASHPDGPRV